MSTAYGPAAAARLTGLPIDTLRAWERRYGAVKPTRDARGRLYSTRDVARLKQLAALVAEGHAIGRIAALPDAALRRLRGDGTPQPAAAVEWPGLPALRQALVRYDLDGIEAVLNRYALVLPPHELIFGVVLPLLRDVGERWESGAVCPAQEHLVSGVVRSVLGGLLRALSRSTSGDRIVFATPAGQHHELGLLCGAVLAAAAGRPVLYLGPNLPAADIADAVKRSGSSTVVLANTVAAALPAGDVASLKRLARGVTTLLGGAHAAELRGHLGTRGQLVPSLEAFRQLL